MMSLALPNDTFRGFPLLLQSIAHPGLLIQVSQESVHALQRYGSRKRVSAAATFFVITQVSDSTAHMNMIYEQHLVNGKNMTEIFKFFFV
jgi:hypothetical protein